MEKLGRRTGFSLANNSFEFLGKSLDRMRHSDYHKLQHKGLSFLVNDLVDTGSADKDFIKFVIKRELSELNSIN